MNYSSTTIVGRITRNAKVFAANGNKKGFIAFSVAVNGSGNSVTYFDVAAGESFAKIGQHLVAGKEVLVEGSIALNQYKKADGSFGASLKLYANRVQLGSDTSAASAAPNSEQSPQFDEDGLPY